MPVTDIKDQLSTFGPGQKVVLGPWVALNLATNQSAAVVDLAGVAGNPDELTMPYAGSILAVSVCLDTALATGTATVFVTKNGTTVLSTGTFTAKTKTAVQGPGVDEFSAGDRIGIKITSTANISANRDFAAMVVVEL